MINIYVHVCILYYILIYNFTDMGTYHKILNGKSEVITADKNMRTVPDFHYLHKHSVFSKIFLMLKDLCR